jgi:methylated-DNA-protein-cysteine methyltransferase-like protein
VDWSKAQQLHERIYRVVRQVPAGQAATYGQVALVAGLPSARMVGRALAALPDKSEVPWHRVINSQGKLAPRSDGKPDPEQRRRLRAEGVQLDRQGRIDFARFAWTGPTWSFLEAEDYDLEELILKSRHRRRTGPWCRWRF